MYDNRKIKTALKEIEWFTLKDLLKKDIFENMSKLPDETIKDLIDVVVENKVKQLLQEACGKPGCKGRLVPVLGGLLNYVNFNTIDENNFTPRISDLTDDEIIKRLSDKTYKELIFFRRLNSDLSRYVERVNAGISNLEASDPESDFEIFYLDDSYLYQLLKERGYLTETNARIEDALGIPLAFDSVMSLSDSIEKQDELEIENALKNRLNEIPKSYELVNHIYSLLSTSDAKEILKEINNADASDLDMLALLILALRNIYINARKSNLPEQAAAAEAIMNAAIKRFNRLYGHLLTMINNNILVPYVYRSEDGYAVAVVLPVLSKVNEDGTKVDNSVLYGIALSELSQSPIDTKRLSVLLKAEDLLSKKDEFKAIFNKYGRLLIVKNKERERNSLMSIYILSRSVLANSKAMSEIYPNEDIREKIVKEVVTEIVENKQIADLMDVVNTSKEIMLTLTANTMYPKFVSYDATKMLGENITPSEAAFYATVELLGDFLMTQIEVL